MRILDATESAVREGGPSFTLGNRAFRAVWGLVWGLAGSWTPRPLHAWRGLLLRLFGARLASSARVYGGVRVWYPPYLTMAEHAVLAEDVTCYCMAPISIGARAIVSQGAHLCAGTHDISDPDMQLTARPIVVGEEAWIAAEAFVGPGVTVGAGAVLSARAAAFEDLEPWTVYRGNPAVRLKSRRLRD